MGQFNIRFAQPGNIANIFEPGAEGPLWWTDYNDKARGARRDGALAALPGEPYLPEDLRGLRRTKCGTVAAVSAQRAPGATRTCAALQRSPVLLLETSHGGGPGGFAVAQPALRVDAGRESESRNGNPTGPFHQSD